MVYIFISAICSCTGEYTEDFTDSSAGYGRLEDLKTNKLGRINKIEPWLHQVRKWSSIKNISGAENEEDWVHTRPTWL